MSREHDYTDRALRRLLPGRSEAFYQANASTAEELREPVPGVVERAGGGHGLLQKGGDAPLPQKTSPTSTHKSKLLGHSSHSEHSSLPPNESGSNAAQTFQPDAPQFKLCVTLSLPPRILSPNHTVGSIGQRYAKARAIKTWRLKARQAGLEALDGQPRPMLVNATVQVRWFTKTKRHPDPSNCIGWLKSTEDGLTGIIWQDDNAIYWLPPIFIKDKDNPRVELIITR